MKLNIIYSIVIFTIISFVGCNRNNNEISEDLKSKMMLDSPNEGSSLAQENVISSAIPPYNQTTQIKKDKKIKDGNFSLRVNDLKLQINNIRKIIYKFQGEIDSEYQQNNDYQENYNFSIRVPYQNFEKIVIDIESLDVETLDKNIQVRNVSNEYYDLESRLKSKRAFIDKYRSMLSQCKNIKDAIEIQEALRIIQEEVESVETQLKSLNNDIEYSIININITKNKDYKFKTNSSINFIQRFIESIYTGFKGVISIIMFFVSIWPLYIILGGLYIIYKKIRNRKNK